MERCKVELYTFENFFFAVNFLSKEEGLKWTKEWWHQHQYTTIKQHSAYLPSSHHHEYHHYFVVLADNKMCIS